MRDCQVLGIALGESRIDRSGFGSIPVGAGDPFVNVSDALAH